MQFFYPKDFFIIFDFSKSSTIIKLNTTMFNIKSLILAGVLLLGFSSYAQENHEMLVGACCTSIQVGKNASTDGSVITSHTCDGRYRTWMRWEPAADHEKGEIQRSHRR